MAFKTLTIKESAYKALKKFKNPGESFSDTIEREFGQKIATTSELLEWTKSRMGTRMGIRQRKNSQKAVA
ncbi:hypothetical protein OpiT1DRAFT_00132 [Opitutaceae bacterium TAV1]|nr:hypothetical protein OpiT1DRAFT_00132 [Opitutaceae bacterium TAV1]